MNTHDNRDSYIPDEIENFWMAQRRMGFDAAHIEKQLEIALHKYEPYSAASLLASLLTFPQLQENQYRIEFLLSAAVRFCRGKSNLSYKRLGELLNGDCPEIVKMQEDPLEDVYISTTGDSEGEYLIFEGAFEENAFFLQELLEVLNVRPPQKSDKVLESIRAALRLSHRTVNECGLARWVVGQPNAKGDISLPAEKQLRLRAKLLTLSSNSPIFKAEDIQKLSPFIECYSKIDDERLPRYPIIRFKKNKLLLAHPSAISIAARTYAIEQFESNETLHQFQKTLRHRRRHYLQEEYFQAKFGVRKTDYEIVPDRRLHDQWVDEALVEYDAGHNAYFLFIYDNLEGFKAKDTYSFVSPPPDLTNLIQERINIITQYCNDVLNARIGVLVIVMCGFGRGISFGINELPRNWHFLPLSLADISNLRDDGKTNLIQLTRYLEEKKRAEEKGIEIGNNFSGFLNEYAYWKDSDYNFVPLDFETKDKQPLMLAIGPDYLAKDRIENRISRNYHYVKYREGRYLAVSRFEQYSFFREDRLSPIYASIEASRSGGFLGLIDTDKFIIWVQISDANSKDALHRFAYNCWRTVLYSISRARELIGRSICFFKREPIHLYLDFSDFSTDDKLEELVHGESEALRLGTSKSELRANIHIPKGFLPHLAQPENSGEQYLISAVLECLSELLLSEGGQEIDTATHHEILHDIFPDKYARQMHFFMQASDIEHIVNQSLNPDNLLLVPEAEKSSLHCDLAWVTNPKAQPGLLDSKNDCNEILQKTAFKLFRSIVDQVAKLDSESLILFLLENVELANLEDTRWSNTSRAVISTHRDRGDALQTVARIKFRRTEAAAVSRILIEIALCPTNQTTNNQPSEAEIGRLLATTSEMLSLATQADAIHLDMVKPGVLVRNNGAIHISDEARDDLTYNYLSDSVTDSYEIEEEEYEAFYKQASEETSKAESIETIDPDFSRAFEIEYGISMTTFRDIFSCFLNIAYENSQAVIKIDKCSVEERIAEKHNLTNQDLAKFLHRFAFKPRSKWESDDKRSNKPWLLQRKFSLTLQPIILLPAKDEQPEQIMYGIQSIERGLRYNLSSLSEGWQEESVLESNEAREYMGRVSHRKGRDFERKTREAFRTIGWQASDEILMRTIGAPETLGDIDSVVWRERHDKIYLIECKRLKFSRTPREIASQLQKFSGNKEHSDDLLGKHLKRLDWLNNSRTNLLNHLGLNGSSYEFVPIVVTNRIVPMQYRKTMPIPKERFIFIDRLSRAFS